MKSILRTAAAGVAIASLGVSSAASAATASANAEADILTALSVSANGTRLDFGSIAESGTGGTVTVSPANAQTCSAGLACDGLTAVPTFTVTGVAGETVDISFVNPSETLTSGANTMTLGTFTSSTSQLTLTGGTGTFTVGGTLTVAAGQAPGAYTGVVNVSVAYN